MIQNSISWFEIPVTDFDRARDFYSYLFDFDMPTERMENTLMGFLPVDEGGIGGAICQGDAYQPSRQGCIVYLNGGDDLQVLLDRVEDAGGEVITPKTLITEGMGYYALFRDCEGNRIGLISPN